MSFSALPYTPHHRTQVLHLLEHHARVHYHLDWHPLQTWLKVAQPPSLLVYDQDQHLMGAVLLMTPYRATYSWIRLFALHDDAPSSVGKLMLDQIAQIGAELGIVDFLAIESDPWFGAMVLANQFRLIDQIVHFRRPPHPLRVQTEQEHGFVIRSALRRDLQAVVAVDNDAFDSYWNMRLADFQSVYSSTTSFKVAERNHQIIGYQLTMPNMQQVHLGRLAVRPDSQGQGVASALVRQLITEFPHLMVTVNTQASNIRSQHLYKHLGFDLLSFKTPIWQRKVMP